MYTKPTNISAKANVAVRDGSINAVLFKKLRNRTLAADTVSFSRARKFTAVGAVASQVRRHKGINDYIAIEIVAADSDRVLTSVVFGTSKLFPTLT